MASSNRSKDPKTTPGAEPDLIKKIEETDELKLKMLAALDKPESDDALYPPELNAHLIQQLNMMTCENNELRKLVHTRDQELKESATTIQDLNQRIRDIISGTGPAMSSKSAGVISAKIAELCKQNRHLVAEITGYKTKTAKLERKIMELELINKDRETEVDACICNDEPAETTDVLKSLTKKLQGVTKKMVEYRNKNTELKNEIMIATKVLQQELGDKFSSLKDLQNELAGWKGRAQQITWLQTKIVDLEEKLHGKKEEKPCDPKRPDQPQIIKNIEMKKKREMEDAQKNLDALKAEHQDLKKKLDAAKCRIRNLECDVLTTRQKMQTFAEKSTFDDQLIGEQRKQLKSLEQYYQEVLAENTNTMTTMHNEITEYKKLLRNTDDKVDALRKQAGEKATKIEELRKQLLRYEECSLQNIFFTPMKTATDNEIQQLSQLVKTLNERLDEERRKWNDLDTANRKIKDQKRRLEKKIASLEEELKTKDRRSSRNSTRVSIDVSQIGFKKASQSTIVNAEKESVEGESVELDKEDLKFKLDLTEEKLKLLEDKLKMVEEEKQEDYANLTEMIQTSKQLFNEALMVLQKERCNCI